MKKILFLALAFFVYTIDCCVDLHRFTIIKDGYRNERTFIFCNDSWYWTETSHNLSTNETEILVEKVKIEGHIMDPLIEVMHRLSADLSERMPTLVSLLDEETKKFLMNKEFVTTDDGQISILILNRNDEMIELVSREATTEERKICIKMKALEYATIKKALAENQKTLAM